MTPFLQILLLLFATLVNIIFIKQTAFEKDKPTCDNYILNTYLYVLLGFLLISIILIATYENKDVEQFIVNIFSSWLYIILFMLIYIGLIVWFYTTDPKDNLLMVHILWLLLILFFSLLVYMPVKIANVLNVLKPAIIATLLITIVVVYCGIKYGDKLVKYDWDKYLRIGLIGIIICYFGLIFIPFKNRKQISIILSVLSLIIFVLLLLSYNKKLTERAEECYTDNNPNYPKESIGIVIKIINIFTNIAKLMGGRKKSYFK